MSFEYLNRLVDPLLKEILSESPAVLIVGPRAAGKTTTGARHAATTLRLDQEARAVAVRSDPDAALRGLVEPVLIDEWQMVPEVLAAVKRSVDIDPRPGRFIITGSVRALMQSDSWPLTGRAIRVYMAGITERELSGNTYQPTILDTLISEPGVLAAPDDLPDLRTYVDLAVRSGFPEAIRLSSPLARRRWLSSYIEELIERDADALAPGTDPGRLRQYLAAWAINTAGVTSDALLYETAGITRDTALVYDRLLTNLVVIEPISAWATNRIKRLTRQPKRLVCDPGLACALLGVDAEGIMADGDLLGRIIETFVFAQLREEVQLSRFNPVLHHLRTEGGRQEVDAVIEYGAGRVIGIEIKSKAAPTARDARHLHWLRDQLGDKFVRGVVFHTGPAVYPLGDKVSAIPIAALWA